MWDRLSDLQHQDQAENGRGCSGRDPKQKKTRELLCEVIVSMVFTIERSPLTSTADEDLLAVPHMLSNSFSLAGWDGLAPPSLLLRVQLFVIQLIVTTKSRLQSCC